MANLNDRLRKLDSEGRSIRLAIVGLGQMGSSLVSQIRNLKGMDVLVIANRDINKAAGIAKKLNIGQEEILLAEADNRINDENRDIEKISIKDGAGPSVIKKFAEAVNSGRIIIIDEPSLLFEIDEIDIVVDATGNPETGAYIALESIKHGKHIVTLNVETDTAIGPQLKKMADSAGLVYTVAAGDEPAALKELYDFATMLGLEVIAAGKGKNNPLDRHANPSTMAAYSREKGSSARMMTSFVDGTKSMVEMACFSNATGLVPDIRGMHGPAADIDSLTRVFSLKSEGGILNKSGIVDFAIGDVAPGVFLIYTSDLKIIREELKYLLFGDGPNYLLYRPYHLTSIEVPISIAQAYFYNEPTIAPKNGLVSEVITIAKKSLKAGETIDGLGGYSAYGLIELHQVAEAEGLLPLGLSEGCVLKHDILADKPLKYDDVELVKDSIIVNLRKLQDQARSEGERFEKITRSFQ